MNINIDYDKMWKVLTLENEHGFTVKINIPTDKEYVNEFIADMDKHMCDDIFELCFCYNQFIIKRDVWYDDTNFTISHGSWNEDIGNMGNCDTWSMDIDYNFLHKLRSVFAEIDDS